MKNSLWIYFLIICCCTAATGYSAPATRHSPEKKVTAVFSRFKLSTRQIVPFRWPVSVPAGQAVSDYSPFVITAQHMPVYASLQADGIILPAVQKGHCSGKVADVERVLKEWQRHIFPAHYFW
ncbi:MAG TPA: hypothetical protein PKC69_01020 [Chitinophagaceae bacterium]|nr:hypothetical protein [Chitinophagaceae bacterium]